jgi:hypothetical protein
MPINVGQSTGTLTKTIPDLNRFSTFSSYNKQENSQYLPKQPDVSVVVGAMPAVDQFAFVRMAQSRLL